jgi:SAM-dependent methyltransferase
MNTEGDVPARITEALSAIREQVEHQLGVGKPPAVEVDPATLVRFSPNLPQKLSLEERHALIGRADELHPWLQGPFLIADDLVIGGTWRTDDRWVGLGEHVGADLSNKRVLDVGSNAGYDAFMFNLRGAEYVLACEPFEFHQQALFLNSIYQTPVDFQQLGWQDLDPEMHGVFDIVHCNGVLYHELHPMLMIQKLREMVADNGKLLLGSMVLERAETSEYVRFVPCEYYGDPTWWWVPGRLAIRWMLETSGFVVEEQFGTAPGPSGEFPVVTTYFLAAPADD